jgi:hypothetical protein
MSREDDANVDRFKAATWGTIAFLIPTEIFPSNLRAQGNGFGVLGWALGVGMTVLGELRCVVAVVDELAC